MKQNKLYKIIIVLLLTILFSFIFINSKYSNNDNLKLTRDILGKQVDLENNFKIDGFTLDNPNIIINPYGNSPLTALVIFKTEEPLETNITVKGKDELSTIRGTNEKTTEHYVPIYGLYGGQKNEVMLEVGNKSKTLIIETEDLPEDIAVPSDIKANKDKLDEQLYFFTPSSKGYTSAFDANGDVRWYLTGNMAWDISRLQNGRLMLSTDRQINPPYFTTGLYEIDLLGKVYNEYSLPGGYHHDFYELENGNLIIASNEFDNKEGTVEDVIVEVDRKTGDIVKTWDLKNVLNMKDGKSENWSEYDWFHNNSVWYNKKENEIILSGRHQDAVIAIDYDNGELKWIIGDPTNWSEEYLEYFFKPIKQIGEEFEWQWSQHAAMVTPEDYIFILDNGNNKSKVKDKYVPAEESYTRGVMYDIDRENMTIKQVWQYGKQRGPEFYSPYISDVDYLGKSHYIVHSGGIVYKDGKLSNQPAGFNLNKNTEMYSTTVELLNDEVVFELTLRTNMYRTEKMSLYNEAKFELGKGKKLGGLGETASESEPGLPKGAKSIKDIDKDIDLKLTNEIDRLVIEGKFKDTDVVDIYLYKNFQLNKYNVRVSKRPYTALCIDIFTPEESENGIKITKNINKVNMNGKYSIYIKINNELYNTGKSINI